MDVDERIVVKIPRTVAELKARRRMVWIRRAVMKAMWEIREKVLLERGYDIFNLFVMTDCIEVSIKGDLEAKGAEKRDVLRAKHSRYCRERYESDEPAGW